MSINERKKHTYTNIPANLYDWWVFRERYFPPNIAGENFNSLLGMQSESIF